jgi:hypothetical protein
MQNSLWKLTSIKLLSELYGDFKSNSDITLQKLVNRAMLLYLEDDTFADKIKETKKLKENFKTGY